MKEFHTNPKTGQEESLLEEKKERFIYSTECRMGEKGYDGAILIKGGHLVNDAIDLLYAKGSASWFSSPRIDNPNTHGTGCTLSSAIACNLACGYSLEESIRNGKDYLTGALGAMLDLGKGAGPMNHMFRM